MIDTYRYLDAHKILEQYLTFPPMWYVEIINQQDYEKTNFYEGHRFHREVIEPRQVLIENVLV